MNRHTLILALSDPQQVPLTATAANPEQLLGILGIRLVDPHRSATCRTFNPIQSIGW
jgi:hypothetical protein